MEIIDYTEILNDIKTTLGSISVYCWGLLVWNMIVHIRNKIKMKGE